MFNSALFENSAPEGFGVLEITSDETVVKRRDGVHRVFVPLRRTELRGEVSGPLAGLRLVQEYSYTAAQCAQVLEAVYRFPLPGDAAVTAVRVRFGEHEIRAELKERRQAERTYKEAKQAGQQAALLTRESVDVFTLRVAGLKPDEPVTIETSYVQLARAEGSGWTLRIPLTTAPRYTRDDEAGSRHAEGQPLFVMRDPGHRFTLDVRFGATGRVESPTHRLRPTPLAHGEAETSDLRVQLQDDEVIPDRDCVLRWTPPQGDHPTLQVLTYDDTVARHLYFLALVAPPARHDKGRGIAREVILLVDHSGSMGGAKWEASDWAVKRFLMDLNERDTFALGLFHDTTQWFASEPRPATRANVQEAIHYLEKSQDSGGTNLGPALEQALHLSGSDGERGRQVLIITDAEVSDEGRILRLADEAAAAAQRRRISVLCIDAAPNSYLATELAERGGGISRFLTSNPQSEDITTALDEVLADWAEPVVTGLHLEVNRPTVEAAGRDVVPSTVPGGDAVRAAIDLGDLPLGRSVWVAGRIPRAGDAPYFRLTTAAGREVALVGQRPTVAQESSCAAASIKRLFGARRVAGLEFLLHGHYRDDALRQRLTRLGYDPVRELDQAGQPERLYAENARVNDHDALHALLVREALHYGLTSAETAFVAVRRVAGQKIEGTVGVGNALPEGWSEEFIDVPGASYDGVPAPAPMQMPMTAAGGVMRARLSKAMPMRMSAAEAADPSMTPPVASAGGAGLSIPSFLSGLTSKAKKASSSVAASAGASQSAPAEHGVPSAGPHEPVLFSGQPTFTGGEAVLFKSSSPDNANVITGHVTISRLIVRFPGGVPENFDVTLLIYVDDLAAPRARVRLSDLMQQGGERPLNVRVAPGQLVLVVLADPNGAWANNAPAIEVAVRV